MYRVEFQSSEKTSVVVNKFDYRHHADEFVKKLKEKHSRPGCEWSFQKTGKVITYTSGGNQWIETASPSDLKEGDSIGYWEEGPPEYIITLTQSM